MELAGLRRQVGNKLSFLVLISWITLVLINPAMGRSSIRSLRRNEQFQRHLSLARSPSSSIALLLSSGSGGIKLLNSTRNSRQVPEIPALYSAPKIPEPEIPALYSAPDALENNDGAENEVDSTSADTLGRIATTEISVEEMDEENELPEETSSEDFQEGIPTEKYPNDATTNPEEMPFNDYMTDSPSSVTSSTNEQDDEEYNDPTEDSYSMGFGRSGGPSSEYGAPNAQGNEPSAEYGVPMQTSSAPPRGSSPTGQEMKKNGNGMYPDSRRPEDQQQIENNMQPISQTEQGMNANGEPQSFYLPPSASSQNQLEQPQQNQQPLGNGGSSPYGADLGPQYQQPPNPNYKTLPDEDNEDMDGKTESDGYPPSQNEAHPPYLNQQNNVGESPQHEQGQRNFGNGKEPSPVYGPPSVNHFGNEEELEGLNGKIVDAEMLERVQQIIEDHENQQKLLLDAVQNEKSSFGYPPASSQPLNGNELNNSGFSSPDSPSGYGFPSGYNNYNGNGDSHGSPPLPVYGPPSFSSPNQNHFSNDLDGNGEDSNRNSGSSPSSPSPVGGRGKENEPRKLSADVEYQKAILSKHFTESEPSPRQGKNEGKDSFPSSPSYQNNNQLNSFAGPGQEYLPPSDISKQGGRSQQGNSQSSRRYTNGFPSDNAKSQSEGAGNKGRTTSFDVKVGAAIVVGDNEPRKNPPNSGYLPPNNSQQQEKSRGSQEFYQYDSSQSAQRNSGGSGSFPPKPTPGQLEQGKNQVQYLPPSQSPQTNPQFWSRTQLPSQPQTSYGPPSLNDESKFPPLGTNYNNNNGDGRNSLGSGGAQNQINYSNGFGSRNNGNNQGAISPQQFYQPQQQQPQQASGNGVGEPRPIYGIPLAPVITLDSNNNFQTYSPTQASPNSNYLPPSALQFSSPSGQAGLSGSYQLRSPPVQNTYGNPSSSASSTFLTIQGENGKNHVYNINHNDYGRSSSYMSSGSNAIPNMIIPDIQSILSGESHSGSVSPGLSNTFTLPLYDYSSGATPQLFFGDQRVGASSTSSVVLPLQSILEQLPFNDNLLPSASSSVTSSTPQTLPSVIVYAPKKTHPKGFRVSRRALSKQGSVSASNPSAKQLSTTSRPRSSST